MIKRPVGCVVSVLALLGLMLGLLTLFGLRFTYIESAAGKPLEAQPEFLLTVGGSLLCFVGSVLSLIWALTGRAGKKPS